MDEKQILALPIHAWRRAKKRLVFELACGQRFAIRGGRDRREPPPDLPCINPDDMIKVLRSETTERDFVSILKVMMVFPGSTIKQALEKSTGTGGLEEKESPVTHQNPRGNDPATVWGGTAGTDRYREGVPPKTAPNGA